VVQGQALRPIAQSLAAGCEERPSRRSIRSFSKRETRLPVGATNRIKEKNF
jgi:hypothetical protein